MFRRKRRSYEDFQAEMESHLALEADEAGGAGREEAEAAARRVFGNVTNTGERWYEHGRVSLFDNLSRDLRLGLRQIRRKPGFALFVILTLAAGIGANAAIFSIVEAVLLRPLPYRDPGRLAMLFSGDPSRELHEGRVSLLNFYDWKARNHSFEDLTAYVGQTFLLHAGDTPERMRSARVFANFWPLLGVKPLIGRVFSLEEERAGARVAVLSYRLWQTKFGGSNRALGQTLQMDDRTYTVIGVMPPEFQFPFADTAVWEPVTAHPYWTGRDRRALRSEAPWLVLGRLKTGATWNSAQWEMDGLARAMEAENPGTEMPAAIPIVQLSVETTGPFRLSLWLLLGSVFLILLIACINVAGLLLARGAAREREFAIRRAIGAGRWRIAGQVLAETLVLASCGGLLGLLVAGAGRQAIQTFGPSLPRLAESRVDWGVALFTAGLTIFAALASSLWPAFEGSKTALASRQWRSHAARRAGDVLVVGEFALALILIVSASLLVRSFVRLRAVELGFQSDHLLAMRIDLHVGHTQDQLASYFEEAARRAEALPGVLAAGSASGFLRTDPEDSVEIEGRAPQHPGPCYDMIAGDFFEAAGTPLLRGRLFTAQDRGGAPPVAIINQTMARAYWPGSDPIGKRFRFRQSSPWLTVVGVTGDMRRQGVDRAVAPQAFLPNRQNTEDMMDVIVRTAGDPAAMAATVHREMQAIDKSVARFRIETVTDQLAEQTGERRFDTFLVGGFAVAALLLAAIGVYVLLHHVVAQRTGEIGVRMALGATPGAVLALLLRQGLALALAGAGIGLAAAWWVCRVLSKLLFEVAPTDFETFVGSALALLAVAALACWIPARAAARIDPMTALRQD